ncbi:MAG: DUF3781 domain-containing protein [Marinifilaceae bacterium]|jgi:hypothetical protein|nr:DUF3781 domain-containing protein [Marinifilaceae bacterium]
MDTDTTKSYKKDILDKICYTDLVYGRINKKLNIELSRAEIENLIISIISETDESNFHKKGKNIYIFNTERNIRLTINSYTTRIITADKIKITK